MGGLFKKNQDFDPLAGRGEPRPEASPGQRHSLLGTRWHKSPLIPPGHFTQGRGEGAQGLLGSKHLVEFPEIFGKLQAGAPAVPWGPQKGGPFWAGGPTGGPQKGGPF